MKYNMTGNLQFAVIQYESLYTKLRDPGTTKDEREQLLEEIRSLADECDWRKSHSGSVLYDAMKDSVRNNLDYITFNATALHLGSFTNFCRLLKETCDVFAFVIEGEHYYMNILIHIASGYGYRMVGTTTREEKDEDGNTSDTIYGLFFSR